jgi:hypothetical protein
MKKRSDVTYHELRGNQVLCAYYPLGEDLIRLGDEKDFNW